MIMLAVIDWVNAVVIPIILTLVVGGALNLWMGVVIADILEFRRVMNRLTRILIEAEHTKSRDLIPQLNSRFNEILDLCYELCHLGQEPIAVRMMPLCQECLKFITDARLGDRLSEVRSLDLPTDLKKALNHVISVTQQVRNMKPNYVALFFLRFGALDIPSRRHFENKNLKEI